MERTEKRTKRKSRIYLALCVVLAAIEAAAFYLCAKSMVSSAAATQISGMKIVLDAGHGGIDGGVTGRTSGVKESELNLEITYLAAEKFREAGFETALTRKTEEGLYGAATKGYKKRDMRRRREIIEEERPAAVISVHQNFYPSSFSRGGQVFYLKNSAEGAALAECLQNAFNVLYGGKGVRTRKKATGDFFMLSCTNYPSALVECGFLSNPKDEALLLTDDFKRAVATAIVEGTIAYLSSVTA